MARDPGSTWPLATAALALALALLARSTAGQDVIGQFPVVEVPPENPLTAEKVRLGQALFHEEQLSSDDTMACATCHRLELGGGDPRAGARHPGVDGHLGTADDERGSFGVVLRDRAGEARRHPVFGDERQVTPRAPPTVIGAAFFNVQFWDTRALPVFRDEAGAVVIAQYGSLESQAVVPPMASAEMASEGRTWAELTAKLARARPLALASDVPAGLAEFVGAAPDYGALFAKAFGTPEVTRERVAMAIASYERTLVSDQSPFDLGTLSERQQRGFELYKAHGACELCHPSANGLFSDGARRTISLPDHDRAVKTPTLRNVGLRPHFMSSGQFTSLDQVVRHYQKLGFVHFESPEDRAALLDFVANGLTDPRVARREPPFDRPTLQSERPSEPAASASQAPASRASQLARYTLVQIKTGPQSGKLAPEENQRAFAGHFANMERLAVERKLLVAGPYGTARSDPELRGIFVLASAERAEAETWASTDPTAQAGVFRLEYHALATDAPLLRALEADFAWRTRQEAEGKTPGPGDGARPYVLLTAERGDLARRELGPLRSAEGGVFLLAELDGTRALALLDAADVAEARERFAPQLEHLGPHALDDWFASAQLVHLVDP